MIDKRFLFVVLVLFASTRVDALAPPVARPLHIAAKAAKAIAVVTVNSGRVGRDGLVARYEIKVNENLRGAIEQKCVSGPSGLKIGRKYVVFFDFVSSHTACGSWVVAGVIEPSAFEVDTSTSNRAYVRLDNPRVISPKFDDSIEVKQSVEINGNVATTVLGTMVPLDTFVGYVTQVK